MIVKRHGDTHVMQRRRITLEILDGIDVGMEDIRALKHPFRLSCAPLNHIVIVGIHTGYHVLAQRFSFEEVHQHRLLSTRQIALRRQHHLEIALIVLKFAEHRPPEVDIIVTLDIGHNPMARLFRSERIGRFEITRVEISL